MGTTFIDQGLCFATWAIIYQIDTAGVRKSSPVENQEKARETMIFLGALLVGAENGVEGVVVDFDFET